MKLTYGRFEIEINAKLKGEKRNNKIATYDVVNDLITNLLDASEYCNMKGYSIAAESKKKKLMELFDQLAVTGYYDNKE